ncbi:MAG: HYR domain-containing protein, partial [Flavobacteriales bacterium]
MRKRQLLTTLLAMVAFAAAQAQPSSWDWAYGSPNGTNEYVRDIATDTLNGGVYSVGGYDHVSALTPTTVLGLRDGFVTKTDANGNVVWTKQIGGSGDDGCQGVAVGPNGNVYVTGYFSGNNPVFSAVSPAIANNGQQDLFIACYDPNGTLQWVQSGGGTGVDIGFGIAVNASGVFVQGVFKGSSAFSGSNTIAGTNNGHQHVTLLKYSLVGTFQWQIVGYNSGAGDDNAERLACDANGVYATGSFGSTQMNWFNVTQNAAQPGITTTTSGNQNIYVCSISNTGAQNWGKAVGNPTNYTPSANAIAAGCSAIYIAGNTVNASVFPGGSTVSIAGSPGDYLYLAALDKTTGSTKWVRTAYGVDPTMAIAYDLTLNRYGNVLMCGQFQRDTQFSDGTAIGNGLSGGNKADVFVARFTSYGQMDWVLTATGGDDDTPLAVAADNSGGIFTGGQYNEDLNFPGATTINSNNPSYFLTKLTDTAPSYWSNNPTAWFPTTPMCASAASVDLTSTLPAFSREYVDAVTSSSGATNPNNIIGAPNGTVASFSANGNTITADLTVTIPVGNTFSIIWGKTAAVAGTASFQLETSSDNISWAAVTAPTITAASSTLRTSTVQATADTRYVRITMNTAISAINFKVDAIRFFHGSMQGGTWSGTGVTSAGLFNPAGLSGPVVITYTLGSSPCATSTSKTITVNPVVTPGTMTVAPGAIQCPGDNSGTVVLSGFTGTITNWESSTDNFSSFASIANTTTTLSFSNLATTSSYRARLNGGACANMYSAIGTVNVGDVTVPTINCPGNMVVNATAGVCGAVVNYAVPIGTDNCIGATTTLTAGPASGATFPVGLKVVTYTVTDAVGLTATCSFNVTVIDNIAPQITCPANISGNVAIGTCGRVVNYTAPVGTDNCPGATTTLTTGLASGSTFPMGVSTVTYTVTDAAGLTATCPFAVTIIDNIAPEIICPANISVNAVAGTCGAVVNYAAPIGTDNCAGATTARTSGLASGATFPVGVSTVTYTVTDAPGLTASCSFTVTVIDNIAPQITCPANISAHVAADTCGAVVNY